MSTAISEARDDLADELAALPDLAAITVSESWPEAVEPPCIFVTPALVDSYVKRGPTFREHTVFLDVVIVVPHEQPAVALGQLEVLLAVVLINTQVGWALEGVDSPTPTQVVENGAEYLASVVHLSKPVTL